MIAVVIYVSASELAALERLAEGAGIGVGEVVRRIVLERLS